MTPLQASLDRMAKRFDAIKPVWVEDGWLMLSKVLQISLQLVKQTNELINEERLRLKYVGGSYCEHQHKQ